MRVTKEEAGELLERLSLHSYSAAPTLFPAMEDFLRRAAKSLPSRAAVERDRQRRKKRRSAAQTS